MSLSETAFQTHPERFGLWPSVWKLLRLRLMVRYNTFIRSKLRNKIGTIIVVLLLVAAMVGLFWLSGFLLTLLQRPELAEYVDPTVFLDAIPTLILSAAFFLTILTNFGVLLQSLYLSHDMDFLVSSPLPMRAVFLSKLLEAILPNFGLFCAFSIPILFGLGTSRHFNLLYYPLIVILLALLALAAGGMASILVMAVVRVVPAKRVAEVLGVVGAMASILCGQSGNIIRGINVQQSDVGSALGAVTHLNNPWSPLAWAGQGLLSIGGGNWLPGIGLTFLSLALAGGIFAGTLVLAETLYYTGWTSMQGTARRKRAKTTPVEPIHLAGTPAAVTGQNDASLISSQPLTTMPNVQPGRGLEALNAAPSTHKPAARSLLPAAVRGMVLKDFLLLRRDPRNFSQLITPLIVGFVMIFSTRSGGRNGNGIPTEAIERFGFVTQIEVLVLIGLAVFVGWILAANLASMAFSREGKNYWMIKTAPISARHLILSKYIVSIIPEIIFCMIYLVLAFLIRGAPWAYLPFSAAVVILIMAGASGIMLAFGIAGANLEWDRPNRQRLSGGTGCVMSLVVFAYFGVNLLLFILPVGVWQLIGGSMPAISYALGLLLGGIGAAAAAVIPLLMVGNRLERIGEA